jgi:hypothetical protein
MSRRTALFLVITSALAIGCPGPEDPVPTVGCSGTYGGALTGTFACQVTATQVLTGAAVSIYASQLTGSAVDMLPLDFTFSGVLGAQTYTQATAAITSSSTVYRDAPVGVYSATKSAHVPDSGSFVLTLGSVTPQASGNVIDVHGTFSATLVRQPTSAGNDIVSMSVTF